MGLDIFYILDNKCSTSIGKFYDHFEMQYFNGLDGFSPKESMDIVALGGVVVSVLATGPKVPRFKPGRGRWILRVIKSVARLPSEGK
jgi:hypothetical protein